MNKEYAQLKKRNFRINRSIAMDTDLSKQGFNINLNEEALNKARVIRKGKERSFMGALYWLSVLGEKDIKP